MVDEWGLLLGGFVPLELGLWRQVEVVFGACPMNWKPGWMLLLLLVAPPVAARFCTLGGSRGFLRGLDTASVPACAPRSSGYGRSALQHCPTHYVSMYGGCDKTVTHPGSLCPI